MSRTTTNEAGRSARERSAREYERAAARRRERDTIVMAAVAILPLLTYVLVRLGVSRLEAVGIAAFAVVLLVGWRRGSTRADLDDARAWQVGAWGEEATARALATVPGRDVAVFHDVRLPGRRENVDHVVVSRGGVVVVESKRWVGPVVVGRHVRARGETRDEVLHQVHRLSTGVSRYLGGIRVDGFVCVHGARVRPTWFPIRRRATSRGVTFGGPDQLVRRLRRRRRTLRPGDVAEVTARLTALVDWSAGRLEN